MIGKKFLKYTADKRKNLKNRRALFSSNSNVCMKKKRKIINGPDENYGLAEPLNDFLSDDEFKIKKKDFIQSITLSEVSKIELELETRNQSNNQKWFEERRKRLTASNFGRVCKMRSHTSCRTTVYNILYSNIHTNATVYGKQTEEIALTKLETELKKSILKCGLFIDNKIPHLAATPGKIVLLVLLIIIHIFRIYFICLL